MSDSSWLNFGTVLGSHFLARRATSTRGMGRFLKAQCHIYCPTCAALPGAALTLFVIACNLLGDGIRDALDPRARATLSYQTNLSK